MWATQSWCLWSCELLKVHPSMAMWATQIMVHLWPCELLNHGPSLVMWATQSWFISGHLSYSIMVQSLAVWAIQSWSIYGHVSYSIMAHHWPCELLNHGLLLAMWATQSWCLWSCELLKVHPSMAMWATQSWSISGHVSYSIMVRLWPCELLNHGPVSGCVSYSIWSSLWTCELLNHGPSLAMWATQSWSILRLCELLNHGPVSGHVSYSVMVHLWLCELLSHGDLFHHDQCPWGWERAINHGQYQAVHDCMIIQCYQDLNISYHSAGIPTISVTNPRPLHMSAVLFHYTLSSLSCCCSVTWGEEVLHQIFDNWVQHAIKKLDPIRSKFCKNEQSKRSHINDKGS